MDSLVLEESLNNDYGQSDFVSKQWLYVNDNNNGNYNSQIVLDTTALSNSGGYIGWSESFLAIPLVLTLSADATSAASLPSDKPVDYFVGLKNGFWQILHSMSVEFNNGNVIQQTPFLNVFSSFKNLTSWSLDDLKNNGMSCGFYPDTSDSWIYNDTDSAATRIQAPYGQGLSNNRVAMKYESTFTGTKVTGNVPADYQPAGTVSTLDEVDFPNPENNVNEGLKHRMHWLSYNPHTSSANGKAQQYKLLGKDNADTIFKSYVDNSIAGAKIIRVVAKIRLKDICDFFDKLPLLKGSTIRIYINTNQAQSKITTTRTVTANQHQIMKVVEQTLQNGTNPLMLASLDDGGKALLKDAAGDFSYYVNVSIAKNNFPQPSGFLGWSQDHQLKTCRLYAPCYKFNPLSEQRYLSLAPTKKVVYNDIFQYQFNNVSGAFNFLVSNGISNLKSILVVPFVNAENNPNSAAAYKFSTLQSPFSASGGMPDPIAITNFNVQVSGQNLFMSNELYDFEAFQQQLKSSNQLNGNLTTGLTSGLIGEYEFSSGYRYYYADCSRQLPSEDGVPKAIQLLGTVASPVKVDLMVFAVFQKTLSVDVRTGARVE